MTRVIAAIDNSLAAGPVLATARAVAQLFDANLEAVHVRTNGYEPARRQAEAAGLSLRTATGPSVESLVAEARPDDVEALVLGSKGMPGPRPAGGTALEVIGSLTKPVVVVPPLARRATRVERVLLPLEGTMQTSLAPASTLELALDAEVELIALHVYDELSLPRFTDQPQHETEAWTHEFVARYCPHGLRSVRLELRVGRPEEHVLRVAEENDVDLIALGWNQRLVPGRASIVRAVLERGTTPLLLIPVRPFVSP